MSHTNIQFQVNRIALEDLYEGCIVKDEASATNLNNVERADLAAVCAGVVPMGKGKALENYEDPTYGNIRAKAGDEVPIIEEGYCLIRSGAAFSRLAWLKPNSNGQAIAALAGDQAVGVAMQAATDANQFVLCRVYARMTAQS